MQQYLNTLAYIRDNGAKREDRTGTGTLSHFGHVMHFNLTYGFPLLTTKKMHFKSIVHELIWFLSGSTNIQYLKDNNVRIWNEWADENGEVGPLYGKQWRRWQKPDGEELDQLQQAIDLIKNDPYSRRIMVSAWNPGEIDKQALPACHSFYQFYVDPDKKTLSCMMYMRSADMFLGVPFDIASYALLTHLVAHITGLEPLELVVIMGDTHIYLNHLEQVDEQLKREPMTLPKLRISERVTNINDVKFEDFILEGYESHPTIKAKVSV